MPKLKTHRGTAKRVKLTARGKALRRRALHSHLLSSKNRKRKRRLSQPTLVDVTQLKTIRELLCYRSK